MSIGRKKKNKDGYSRRNTAKLVRGGKEYFDCLLHMVATAKESIHLQTYILDDDTTGEIVGQALTAAAARGVKVYVMVDGYASRVLSKRFIDGLRSAGVHFKFFEPIFRSRYFYFGRRLHHKVVVADTLFALVGGVNITDRYNDINGVEAWLDFALYAEGEVARELCILCWKTWNGFPFGMGATPCEQTTTVPPMPAGQACEISMRRNDWVRRKNEISSTYVTMFRNATSHITILCSYFLPGRVIRRHLAEAAHRGVKITVITAGRSDVWMAKFAERYMYKWLLKHNVDIYEYQPTVLHGKVAVCDGRWVTIGSYNINNISAYASIELNMNVRNDDFARETERVLQDIAAHDCIRITGEYQSKTTNIFKKFGRWFSYKFIHLLFYLSTFYYKHKV